MNELNIEDRIKFNLIELNSGEKIDTNGNKIVTVISGKIKDKVKGTLDSFQSSIFHQGKIESVENTLLSIFEIDNIDIILDKINIENEFGEYCRKNWKQLRELYDVEGFEKVDLYRGNQIEKEFYGEKFKFNLRFCGKNVDCLFHNQHDFLEVHTNIAGIGNMQKSIDGTEEGLVETVSLGIGATHKKFNIEGEKEENGNPKYPFHRWLGGPTGNIWLAIEKY